MLHETVHGPTAHIALVGADQRVVEDIGDVPHPPGAQFTYAAITDRYVAFIYVLTNGQLAQALWNLYLFDRRSHRLTLVAHNPTDKNGNPLPSNWVSPTLAGRYLFWIQGARTGLPWGGSEIRRYDLTTGRTRTMYRGLANVLAPYRHDVVFTAVDPHAPRNLANPPMIMAAFDPVTGHPDTAPAGITAAADGAFALQSSGGTLIWNTADAALKGWNARWGRSITLFPSFSDWPLGARLQMSGPGSPRIYHQYVAMYSGNDYVLDLKTNSFVQLTRNAGGEDMSGPALAIEQYTNPGRPARYHYIFDQTVLRLDQLPDLHPCP